jgi:hypothetical protein
MTLIVIVLKYNSVIILPRLIDPDLGGHPDLGGTPNSNARYARHFYSLLGIPWE